MTGSVSASGADPSWGSVQEVPPFDSVHELPRTGVFPDGTLVAVWEYDETGDQDDGTNIFRSTRAPLGDWTEPVTFPVQDVWSLEAIATRPDGSLQIAYARFPDINHRVRIWNADGSVEQVALANTADDYVLIGDAEGDVVAERLGSYDERDGFDHLLRYFDGSGWRRVPKIGADPRDVFVPGPGESVWMAGYDQARSKLRVRRWKPGMSTWKVDWSRDYPPGHLRKPLVDGLDLAVGKAGRAILAFEEREVGKSGDTIRAVRRKGRSGWAKPAILQRLAADKHRTTSAPVVAAVGNRAEVAWTASGLRPERREVRIAQMTRGGPAVRRLATTRSFSGFRDLSLDVDVREDGDILVTFLKRRGSRRQLAGWLGPHAGLQPMTLLKDAGVMIGDSAFLVPGLAGAISSIRGEHLASRVLEE